MPTDRKPNLFIVGAQKSGTSALAGWLSQHPQVCMSFPKEPGFLAFGEQGYIFPDGNGKPAPASKYVVRDERAYLKLFAGATARQSVIAEASTWYFAIPGMADKIKSYSPGAKIIVILRNPVERAYSAWCHARGDLIEPCEAFSSALEMESQRGEVEFLLRYRRMGLYSQALAAYRAVFPDSHLKVLFYDDLRANPLTFWRVVCKFLEVDISSPPDFDRRYNRSGTPRYRMLQKLLRSHRFKRYVRSVLPHRLALRLKGHADDFNLQKFPTMDDTTRSELVAYYRDDIAQLSRMTGRDLEAWLN